MIRLKLLIFIIIAIFITSGCEYIESINKSGENVTEVYQLDSFTSLILEAPFNTILINDSIYYIEAIGYDYLVEDIQLEITENRLIIKHNTPGIIQKSKMPTLYLHVQNIHTIIANSPGVLSNKDTLKLNRLSLTVNGRGTYFESNLNILTDYYSLQAFGEINTGTHTITGESKKASFWMEGCTYAIAYNLKCDFVKFTHKSAADCSIHATDSTNITIFSTGNIELYGNPEIISFSRGESSLLSSTGIVIKK